MKPLAKEQTEPLEQLEGTIEDVVYHNEDNGFSVLEVSVEDELVTVVGEIPGVAPGEEISAMGRYTVHPTYGMQFKAQAITRTLPGTANAIFKYLAGGAIKGIGPALAKRIVNQFGDKSLEVIEKDPNVLAQIKGISQNKAQEIGDEFSRLFGIRSTMLFFTSRGIQPADAIRIWRAFGNAAVDLVKEDPYLLCSDNIGLSFEQVDDIATDLGILPDSNCRLCAGLCHILRHNSRSGHVCLPREKLLTLASGFLQCASEKLEDLLEVLLEDNTLCLFEDKGRSFVYLEPLYRGESYIAGRIAMMLQITPPGKEDLTKQLDELEEELGIQYDQLQRKAISEAVQSPLFILTGGPGTGKTTTMGGIITLLERQGVKVALCAPTGRAAKRMTEVTGREAKTIHRLLEVEPGQESLTFKRNEKNPLQAGAIIVDEMSMVDTLILESLLRGMRMSTKLIMVGDSDQLPSVAAGNILGDLIASEAVPTVHLSTVFRQAAQSLIVTGAHNIVRGEVPDLSRRDNDFFFLSTATPQQAQTLVVDLCARRLPNSYHYSPLWDIQVIVPGKQGPIGTRELNRLLQERLNPPARDKTQLSALGRILREGDKVMQIRNNYDIIYRTDDGEEGMGIFNGDIGVIDMIDISSQTILVRFDDKVAQYHFDSSDQLEHAYAITVHKSQGSEFEAVVMPLMQRHPKLHYRNLLYTGVTRARRLLVMAGEKATVAEMVGNNRRTLRYTNLKEMLWRTLEDGML